ncbi:MAG: helix-turn-helix domain-containing protein [Lachnospiraceae bacterium]|nr:helix-turn-helix domain-containing protein [Lachnospiraceae bacterium]
MGEKIKSRFEEDSISLPAGSVYMIRHNMAALNGKVSLHYHDHYEAFFAVSGDILYNVEGYTYRMEPGHLLLIPPYRLHQPCIHSGHCSERIALRFSRELPEKLNGKDQKIQWSGIENIPAQQYCLEEPQRQEMKTLLQKLLCEDKGNAYGKETVIHALLTCFFVLLARAKLQQGKAKPEKSEMTATVREMAEYIEKNYKNPVTSRQLEKQFLKNYSQLSKEFKEEVGGSPYQYLLLKRLLNAEKLLKEGIPPRTAAEESGFSDYSNFFRQFRTMYGCAPREYYKKS